MAHIKGQAKNLWERKGVPQNAEMGFCFADCNHGSFLFQLSIVCLERKRDEKDGNPNGKRNIGQKSGARYIMGLTTCIPMAYYKGIGML